MGKKNKQKEQEAKKTTGKTKPSVVPPPSTSANDSRAQRNGCIVPGGCLAGAPFPERVPADAVKVLCSKQDCPEILYLHSDCFDRWETEMIHKAKAQQPKNKMKQWTTQQLRANLWKIGMDGSYRMIVKFCHCPCGGNLRKDRDAEVVKKCETVAQEPVKPKKPTNLPWHISECSKPVVKLVESHQSRINHPKETANHHARRDHKVPEVKHFWDEDVKVRSTARQPVKKIEKMQLQSKTETETKTQTASSLKSSQESEVSNGQSAESQLEQNVEYFRNKCDSCTRFLLWSEVTGYEYTHEGEKLMRMVEMM